MTRIMTFAVALGLLAGGSLTTLAAQPDHLRVYTVKQDYNTVKEDIEITITNYGLVIDHTSDIGRMLERTGKDLGTPKPIYGNAGTVQFCTAGISRRTMEADPANIAFCPYIIFFYTLPQDPNTVYVGYRRPQSSATGASRASLQEVEALLDGIVKEALNIK